MLWKDLLWWVLTGISTSKFLLNSWLFFSALNFGRLAQATNYKHSVTPANKFIIWFYCFEADLVGKYEASEQICSVAPTTLYISVPLSIPETFGRTELLDVVIAFYQVILTRFQDFLISGGIPLGLQGQILLRKVSGTAFALCRASLWGDMGSPYSEFVWHDLYKLSRQKAYSNQSFSCFNRNVTEALTWTTVIPVWSVGTSFAQNYETVNWHIYIISAQPLFSFSSCSSGRNFRRIEKKHWVPLQLFLLKQALVTEAHA